MCTWADVLWMLVLQRAPGERRAHASAAEAPRGGGAGGAAERDTAGGAGEHEEPPAETSPAPAETDGGDAALRNTACRWTRTTPTPPPPPPSPYMQLSLLHITSFACTSSRAQNGSVSLCMTSVRTYTFTFNDDKAAHMLHLEAFLNAKHTRVRRRVITWHKQTTKGGIKPVILIFL